MQRVAIMKTRKGYTVYSFDFTENIYCVFTGDGSLGLAIDYCTSNDYDIVNFTHFRSAKKEGRPVEEKKGDD